MNIICINYSSNNKKKNIPYIYYFNDKTILKSYIRIINVIGKTKEQIEAQIIMNKIVEGWN